MGSTPPRKPSTRSSRKTPADESRDQVLTAKQERFVQEYLLDLNATRAARAAGYSERTAESQGSRMLRNVKVLESVAAAQKARAERVEVKSDDVLRELLLIARTDIGDAFSPTGALLPLKQMPAHLRRAISSIEVEQLTVDGEAIGTVAKVKLWDKPKSLELLGKHLRLFVDKVETTVQFSHEDALGELE
ncbi:terminase small subunit [Corallococcus sp. AS-1-6]|uniref:terminase small subunit n=1 Tax=Corallococcus sp. AS-1-6 TaxID=2874599 RepID=UPI001CC1891E|nr:terminase small subunit [Corallococcus sp. AS-1-6]